MPSPGSSLKCAQYRFLLLGAVLNKAENECVMDKAITSQMTEYVKAIAPAAAALVTAGWGVLKYFKDREIKTYDTNIEQLFSKDKAIVLAAISSLDFYKRKARFKTNVVDILTSRLYTELDYDIVNAIISELSQVSGKKEFVLVSRKLLDVNRNFELQSGSILKRYEELRKEYEALKRESYIGGVNNYVEIGACSNDLHKQDMEFVVKARAELQRYAELNENRLAWHKQVLAEAFAMLLLEANRKGITKRLNIKLFENNLSGSHMIDFNLKRLKIIYAAFENSSWQELSIERLSIEHAYFENSLIRRCHFNQGVISNVEFVNVKFDWVTFKNVEFKDVYFIGVEFNNCEFDNVRGLDLDLFYKCTTIHPSRVKNDKDGILKSPQPAGKPLVASKETSDFLELRETSKEQLMTVLNNSVRSMWGRNYVKRKLEEQDQKLDTLSEKVSEMNTIEFDKFSINVNRRAKEKISSQVFAVLQKFGKTDIEAMVRMQGSLNDHEEIITRFNSKEATLYAKWQSQGLLISLSEQELAAENDIPAAIGYKITPLYIETRTVLIELLLIAF
jgi:hypothetical protein